MQNIVKVYSGKSGCMCGCRGKWTYTAFGAREHSPGYDVSDSVNERSVKIIANKVLRDSNKVTEDNCVYVQADGKVRAVYFG